MDNQDWKYAGLEPAKTEHAHTHVCAHSHAQTGPRGSRPICAGPRNGTHQSRQEARGRTGARVPRRTSGASPPPGNPMSELPPTVCLVKQLRQEVWGWGLNGIAGCSPRGEGADKEGMGQQARRPGEQELERLQTQVRILSTESHLQDQGQRLRLLRAGFSTRHVSWGVYPDGMVSTWVWGRSAHPVQLARASPRQGQQHAWLRAPELSTHPREQLS